MTGSRSPLRRTTAALLAVAALLAAAACGSDDSSGLSPGGGGGSDSAEKGTVTMSGQDFTEMRVMAEMYRQVLEADGYTVDVKLVATRDLYIGELSNGRIDLVPEFLAGIGDQLNGDEPFTTNDPQEALSQLEPIASEAGITMLEPAMATDQNAFFVTQEFADANGLTTLSDLGEMGQPITLAAAPDCKGRDDCEAGLKEVYGIDIEGIIPTGYGTQPTKNAVLDGEAELGETGTTDAGLADLGLVLLQDDQGIQPAQNLIPAVNTEFLKENPDIAEVLNELSARLTTEDLASLNRQVDIERQEASDVAEAYLQEQGLL
jgi:osmoprotectant transport system substrate-binding protein